MTVQALMKTLSHLSVEQNSKYYVSIRNSITLNIIKLIVYLN